MVHVPNTCWILKPTYNGFNNEAISILKHLKIKELVEIGNEIIYAYIYFFLPVEF